MNFVKPNDYSRVNLHFFVEEAIKSSGHKIKSIQNMASSFNVNAILLTSDEAKDLRTLDFAEFSNRLKERRGTSLAYTTMANYLKSIESLLCIFFQYIENPNEPDNALCSPKNWINPPISSLSSKNKVAVKPCKPVKLHTAKITLPGFKPGFKNGRGAASLKIPQGLSNKDWAELRELLNVYLDNFQEFDEAVAKHNKEIVQQAKKEKGMLLEEIEL